MKRSLNNFVIPRRRLLLALAALPIAHTRAAPAGPIVEVWKAPTCGCCKDWIAYLEANGFAVKAHDIASATTRYATSWAFRFGTGPATPRRSAATQSKAMFRCARSVAC